MQVRSIEIDALVDTDATFLCLPSKKPDLQKKTLVPCHGSKDKIVVDLFFGIFLIKSSFP